MSTAAIVAAGSWRQRWNAVLIRGAVASTVQNGPGAQNWCASVDSFMAVVDDVVDTVVEILSK